MAMVKHIHRKESSMTKWASNNGWKILAAVAVGLMAWAVLDSDVDRMKPAIVKNAQAIEAVEEEVEAVEKDMITMQASVEALGVRQEALHDLTDTKLDAIKTAIDKRNDSQ